MATPKQSVLIVLSSSKEGVSAASFIQTIQLIHQNYSFQLTSPGGKNAEFTVKTDEERRWMSEFATKQYSTPVPLEKIDGSRYCALIVPPANGAIYDLVHNRELSQIINHFVQTKKPLCAVGMGVGALCCALKEDKKMWSFKNYAMTATSVYELARLPSFASLPVIIEDFIKDNGAKYTCSETDAVHIVIDRHIVTGQNEQSTLTAVQNLILLCNQRKESNR